MPAQARAVFHRPAMSAETWSGFLGALAGAPALPGARCRGRHHLFDEQRPDEDDGTAAARHAQALALCNRCPALDPCQSWFASLPPRKRPTGIIAGHHHQSTDTQRKTST